MSQNLVSIQGLGQALGAANVARSLFDGLGGPMGVLGRFAGFGTDEIEAGVPGWAWASIGFLAGAAAAYALHPRIERVVGGE